MFPTYHRFSSARFLNSIASLLVVSCGAVSATEATPPQTLSLELNTISQQESACRMIFVAQNNMGKELDSAVFETVLFNTDGSVDRLTLFDFKSLPEGRPRVRQFDISGTKCADIGRVLINGAHACHGEGIDNKACENGLKLSTKTRIEIIG